MYRRGGLCADTDVSYAFYWMDAADVDCVTKDRETPLHIATEHDNAVEMIRLLCVFRAEIILDVSGSSPLHYAARASTGAPLQALFAYCSEYFDRLLECPDPSARAVLVANSLRTLSSQQNARHESWYGVCRRSSTL